FKRCASVALLCLLALPALALDRPCAIVLLHGKWGGPQPIHLLGRRFEPVCDYRALEMPWSRRREYDQPYPVALDEIAAQVRALRAQGYVRVLLGGHSFGANAALAYMAEVGDVDAVIALAPGHVPERMYRGGIGSAMVDQARALVAAGQGAETLTMDDLNQGQRRSLRMRAAVLLSYFDPQGLGNMPQSAARFRKAVPLLWVVGTGDPLYPAGAAFGFERAPAHPASKYLVVSADHGSTPEVALPEVLAWVSALP
ncbi:MAG: alpha/beta fold hydrolase, partial [Rhodoferax sp.]